MSDQTTLLSQFSDVTGCDQDRARFFLESANWDLQLALTSFYENEVDSSLDDDPIEVPVKIEPKESPNKSLSNTDETEDTRKDSSSKVSSQSRQTSSRFHTLASLAQHDEDTSDEEEGQAFFAGGSQHSGQQILGPSKKKKNDFVSEMFKSVKDSGVEIVERREYEARGSRPSFMGTGYRLGQTDDDTEMVSGSSTRRRSSAHSEVALRMWRSGFTINDGDLRAYDDPRNSEFLDCIRKGEIPKELVKEGGGAEVHLSMEDHRHEEYVPPKSKVKAFAGKGHVLGSPAPATVGMTTPTTERDRLANEEQAKSVTSVDSSQPVTSLQIRLADGSRLIAEFNHTHTIADIRRYITLARPQYENADFALLTTFPSKELADEGVTIASAGLLSAAIMQRLK